MKRSIELDCIRGVAVLLVLSHHLVDPTNGGWVGVDLFFVLSGFLVAGLVFREYQEQDRVDVARFLIRRGFKIYPPFFFMLAVNVAIWRVDLSSVLPEVLFLQSYTSGFMYHTWSLAVEEHFYLLLALTVLLLVRSKRADPFRPIPYITAVLTMLVFAARLLIADQPYEVMTHYVPTHLRIDELAVGTALAYFYHYHRIRFTALVRKWRGVLLVTGVALISPPFILPLEHPLIHTVGFTIAAVGAACWVAVAAVSNVPRWFPFRLLAFVGVWSYSIYLWHFSPVYTVPAAVLPGWAAFLLAVPVGIVLGFLVERPFLKIRDMLPLKSHSSISPGR